ncbi:hypothetical protein J6590_048966 [Homalodisca vitripennis]|nr:hypothetical protein J6590_048966 [Homalodisca vitripennis]
MVSNPKSTSERNLEIWYFTAANKNHDGIHPTDEQPGLGRSGCGEPDTDSAIVVHPLHFSSVIALELESRSTILVALRCPQLIRSCFRYDSLWGLIVYEFAIDKTHLKRMSWSSKRTYPETKLSNESPILPLRYIIVITENVEVMDISYIGHKISRFVASEVMRSSTTRRDEDGPRPRSSDSPVNETHQSAVFVERPPARADVGRSLTIVPRPTEPKQ